MKPKLFAVLIVLISINCFCETTDIVFRKPFTLELPLDKERYYKQEYPKIPYVADDRVYIFPGEEFRVGILFSDNGLKLTYDDANQSASHIAFKMWTELQENENKVHTFLVGKNNTSKKLVYDAVMVVHDAKNPLKTSIIPIEAGKQGYEHWPHPIMQLMLYNFRVIDDSEESASNEYPSKLYPVIFRIKIDEQGKLIDFGLEKIIDPQSGSAAAIDIEIPESYIKSARTHVIARHYEPRFKDGRPVAFYDYFFYDPKYPDEVRSEIKK